MARTASTPQKDSFGPTRFRFSRLWAFCTLLLLSDPLAGWSQHILFNPGTKKIMYHASGEVDGVTKEELYGRVKKWANSTFKYMQTKPLLEEQEREQVSVDAEFLYHSFLSSGLVSFSCTVSVEDGRYDYVLSDFKYQGFASINYQGFNTQLPMGPPVNFENPAVGSKVRILRETHKQVQFLLADLHQAVSRNTSYSFSIR